MKKLKIACLIESDPEIRNFLLSHALDPVFERHDVTLVLPPEDYKRIKFDVGSLDLPIPVKRVAIPETRLSLWRQSFHHSQMRPRFGRGWWRLWSTWWGVIGWKAALLYTLGNLPGIRGIIKRRFEERLNAHPATEFAAAIRELAPDIIIHPSTFGGYFINDMVEVGREQNIPTMLIMNSWDNPSIKRASSGKADWVAVWGEQTRRHTEFFMEMPRERIVVLGAAQFEAYRPAPRITPAEFRAEHGLPAGKTVLLYAGSSRGTKEGLHLKWLNEAIEAGEMGDIAVVYRPHPWGIGRDQAQMILSADWPHVKVESSMRDFMQAIADGRRPEGFLMAEYARTHDVLSSVDMVISPLSTIIVEGALHGLPVMCFYAKEEEDGSLWKKGVKTLAHFEDIFKSPMVVKSFDYASFLPSVKELVRRAGDPGFHEKIIAETPYFVVFHPVSYGAALLEHLERIFPEAPKKVPS